MPKHLKTPLLAVFLAAISIAQVSSQYSTPDVARVGVKLACLCGGCKNSVADCPMLGCEYSLPAREKIAALEAKGYSDQQIIDEFVKEEGLRALITPPAEGFNTLAWVMPPLMVGMGLALIWWFIVRMRKPSLEPAVDPAVLDHYRDSIEKDLAGFDDQAKLDG